MKKTTSLAFSAIITALSVVLMFLGGVTFVLAYAMPMLVGMFMIMIKSTFGKSYAWMVYVATSLLSFILVADRECVLMYILFFGFYPIVKSTFDKLKHLPIRIICKLMLFNIMLAICQLLLVYVFGIPFLEEGETYAIIIVFAVLMNILFFIYDRLLSALQMLYKNKIEKRIKHILK
ncbi:MAG: hypothetical protein LIO62_01875 [Clostridiales bacterium]|nr:hypothetical protein [Clostridiales bacterium]